MEGQERRGQARIEVETPCTLGGDQGQQEGTVRQISRAGAQVAVPERVGPVGSRATLRLRPPGGRDPVELPTEIIHEEKRDDGLRVGVEFRDLDTGHASALEQIIDGVLGGSGGGSRQFPRVSRRIDVTYQQADEIRGVMCDLSQGGMGLETDQPIEEGETITVRVALGGFPHPLQLEGEVVHVRRTDEGKYQAGLRFQQLDPQRTGGLRDLLQFMVKEG